MKKAKKTQITGKVVALVLAAVVVIGGIAYVGLNLAGSGGLLEGRLTFFPVNEEAAGQKPDKNAVITMPGIGKARPKTAPIELPVAETPAPATTADQSDEVYTKEDFEVAVVDSLDPLVLDCTASPNPARVGQTVTWIARVAEGPNVPSGFFTWSGAADDQGRGITFTSHDAPGIYTVNLDVSIYPDHLKTKGECSVEVLPN